MIRLYFISLFIISTLFISGTIQKVKAQKIIDFSLDDFKEVMELKGEKLNLEEPLMNPLGIILSDTLLFVRNKGASPAVDVISLNSGKVISRFCRRGRGPGS